MHLIRPTVQADLPGLEAVLDATRIFPSELLEELASGFLAGETADEGWLTLEEEDQPVALAHYASERMTDGTWNVLAIAVHPDVQGRGHGSALMRHVEQALAARGERLLLVETSGLPDFQGARAFYRGLGYEQEAHIRDFYAAGDDKVIFRKAL